MLGFLFGGNKSKSVRCDVCGAVREDCKEHALGFVYCGGCSDGKLVEGVCHEFKASTSVPVFKSPVLGSQRG